jgi:KH domain
VLNAAACCDLSAMLLAAPAAVEDCTLEACCLWPRSTAATKSAAGSAAPEYAQVIKQIKNVVGVRIRVSGRDEYIEGTRDRSVTISGPKKGVAIAEQLVRGEPCVAAAAAQFYGTCHDP